jgi:hypothetical protein
VRFNQERIVTRRREFIQHAVTRMAALGTVTLSLDSERSRKLDAGTTSDDWDLSWTSRLTGKHRAVFDVAELESGFGVYRAAAWADQYVEVLKVARADLSVVLVLRAHAVVLALQQTFWDRYEVGRARRVTHPVTLQDTGKNPVLLDESHGLPAALGNAALPKQLGRGVIVLACNLALQSWIDVVKRKRRVTDDEARKEAIAALVPGVILQPSGVFAATLAQEHDCAYIRAS